MALHLMRHFMGEYPGDFFRSRCGLKQAAKNNNLPARERNRIDYWGIVHMNGERERCFYCVGQAIDQCPQRLLSCCPFAQGGLLRHRFDNLPAPGFFPPQWDEANEWIGHECTAAEQSNSEPPTDDDGDEHSYRQPTPRITVCAQGEARTSQLADNGGGVKDQPCTSMLGMHQTDWTPALDFLREP
jgi:hypothetical protein